MSSSQKDKDKKVEVGFGPIQALYDAAKEVVEYNNGGLSSPRSLAELAKAIAGVEEAVDEAASLESIVKKAKEEYSEEAGEREIDVMGYLAHHNGSGDDSGFWIDAWLWFPDPDPKEEDEI